MSAESRAMLADMRASRRQVFAELEGLPEGRLTAPALWGGKEMDARFILLRFADHEEEHALQIRKTLDGFGWRQTEAQQILGAACMTRGDLYGALVGLTDDDIDLTPEGEWPLRLILWHIAQTDRSYTAAITWAAELARAGKAWEPNDRPELLSEDGDLTTFIGHLDREREDLLRSLTGIEDAVMMAPTVWWEIQVDVRFRLMRIAHHEREHTAHLLKWREQVGRPPTDAQRLLSNAWSARGVLEAHLVGIPDALLDREPDNGDGSIRSILEHLQATDDRLKGRILGT
jgi:uncharacterized damage-inducible protein DinB